MNLKCFDSQHVWTCQGRSGPPGPHDLSSAVAGPAPSLLHLPLLFLLLFLLLSVVVVVIRGARIPAKIQDTNCERTLGHFHKQTYV